jgi:hypothetical protein
MPHFDIALQHVLLIWALAFLRAEENGMRLLHFMAENGPFGLLASELNKTQKWLHHTLSCCFVCDQIASSM